MVEQLPVGADVSGGTATTGGADVSSGKASTGGSDVSVIRSQDEPYMACDVNPVDTYKLWMAYSTELS